MPEGVWADGLSDAVFLSQVFDNQENHLACKACATAVEENGVGEFGLGGDVQSCAFNILEEDFQAAVANGYEPFLAAFADDAKKAIITVNVADLQSYEFRNTQSAAIHHLNHGLVAVPRGLAEVDAVNHLLDFLVSQNFGEVAAHGWRGNKQSRVGLS